MYDEKYKEGIDYLAIDKEKLKNLAENGDRQAQYHLGGAFKYGLGFNKDYKQAAIWYERAAKQGHMEAQHNLAVCYEKGEGVKKNLEKSAACYLSAAKQGYEIAQFNVGLNYKNGVGVKKDLKEAAKWFLLGAEQGNTPCQFNYGVFCLNGMGMSKDEIEGIKWISYAAKQGHVLAVQALIDIQKYKPDEYNYYKSKENKNNMIAILKNLTENLGISSEWKISDDEKAWCYVEQDKISFLRNFCLTPAVIRETKEKKYILLIEKVYKKDITQFLKKIDFEKTEIGSEDKKIINFQHEEIQENFLACLLMGNTEECKNLLSKGASLRKPNQAGLYPLVAAVYSTNFYLLKEVEENLGSSACFYWSKVDLKIAIKNIDESMPEKCLQEVNYFWLGKWYEKNANKGWCSIYDQLCLSILREKYQCTFDKWLYEEWKYRVDPCRDSKVWEECDANDLFEGLRSRRASLLCPPKPLHNVVVKFIHEQLGELKCNIENKVKSAYQIKIAAKLLAQGYRDKNCLFSVLPKEVNFKIASLTGNAQVHSEEESTEIAKYYFSKPSI